MPRNSSHALNRYSSQSRTRGDRESDMHLCCSGGNICDMDTAQGVKHPANSIQPASSQVQLASLGSCSGREPELLLKAAALPATFGLVGIEHADDDQIGEIAAKGRGFATADLRAAIEHLIDRGAAQRRGRMAILQPRPIAMKLAERQWREWSRVEWNAVLTGGGNIDLKVLAARQLAWLNTTDLAQGVLALPLRRRNGFGNMLRSSSRGGAHTGRRAFQTPRSLGKHSPPAQPRQAKNVIPLRKGRCRRRLAAGLAGTTGCNRCRGTRGRTQLRPPVGIHCGHWQRLPGYRGVVQAEGGAVARACAGTPPDLLSARCQPVRYRTDRRRWSRLTCNCEIQGRIGVDARCPE